MSCNCVQQKKPVTALTIAGGVMMGNVLTAFVTVIYLMMHGL